MSPQDRNIDLEALARPVAEGSVPPPRRRWIWWLVPMIVLGGFALVFLDTAKGLLSQAISITVVRPQMVTDAGPGPGSIVFQAAGWIEPDPYPVRVTALAKGVVKKMLVEEADPVKANDVICELVSDDALIAVAAAEAALAHAQANVTLVQVEKKNAQESFIEAVDVTEARDSAKAELRMQQADHQRRKAAAQEAEAAVRVAEHDLATQEFLRKEKAAGPWQVELAQARLDEARSRHTALQADVTRAVAGTEKAQASLHKAERHLELRLEERLVLDTATAAIPRAQATALQARATLDNAKLQASRMKVTAPINGVVLIRDAQPGSVVGPGAEATAICHLYDPEKLRVRVDVPQGQVAGVSAGQRAEIRCDVRRQRPYQGKVLRIVDAADIQKVTLEVQVRVIDPDGLLKPDMLCQVAVYRDPGSGSQTNRSAAVRIPARCLAAPDSVWVLDGNNGRATRRQVKTGSKVGGDVIILEGLNMTDKVVDRGMQNLEEGARVKVEERP